MESRRELRGMAPEIRYRGLSAPSSGSDSPRMLRRMALSWCVISCLLFLTSATALDYENYLDNGEIRVGIDTSYGGAITYLSVSGQTYNLVNIHDTGRMIQQSYYAGEFYDRTAEGQNASYSPWPWNPVQAGDNYGKTSTVADSSNDGNELYVKTIPLLWDMNDESAECFFEMWITLDGKAVHVRNKLSTFRTDSRWGLQAIYQELPAVYTIGDLSCLYTYVGDAPFTGGALTSIVNSGPPWMYWGGPDASYPEWNKPTEKWAAHVDDSDWGVGVYTPTTVELYGGGFYGTAGGGAHDSSTGYMQPAGLETLGKDTVYTYDYYLIVGTLSEIRAFVYDKEPPPGEGEGEEQGHGGGCFGGTTLRDPFSGGVMNNALGDIVVVGLASMALGFANRGRNKTLIEIQ